MLKYSSHDLSFRNHFANNIDATIENNGSSGLAARCLKSTWKEEESLNKKSFTLSLK